jgi:O-antigen ligase
MAIGGASIQALSGMTPARWLRRRDDLSLAVALGGLVALLMLALPMEAALASSVIGAFVILALVDTKAALLSILFVRATIDVTATVPLLSASGSSNVNAAAMMSFLIIGLAVAHISLSRIDIWRVPLVKPFATFLLVTFLGIAVAPEKARALQDWLRIGGVFMLYVLVVDLMRSAQDRRWMLRVILLSSVVPLALGFYQLFTNTGNHETEGLNRVNGTFVHPSPYASYLVQLVPLAFVYFLHTRSRLGRVAMLVLMPAMVFSIYATQTRVAWIGLIVVIMIFMATRARWTLVLVPIAAGAMFFALPSVQARFNEAGSNTGSVFWRQHQWENAIAIASTPKLVTVGAGLGAVDVKLHNLTHNEYVRLLVETGMMGLAVTIYLYWKLLQLARKGYREAPTPYQRDLILAFIMALASRVVIAASDNVIAFPVLEWYFWSFAAVVVVLSGAYKPKQAQLDAPADSAAA